MKTTEFPFEAVHAHFAKPLVGLDISGFDFPPVLAFVLTDETGIAKVDLVPPFITEKYFRDISGKVALGQFIREAVAKIGDFPACIVMICEAYYREICGKSAMQKAQQTHREGLANDPEAKECIFIQIYTATDERHSRMPITSGRVIEYAPLDTELIKASGRFSMHPEEADLPDGARFH